MARDAVTLIKQDHRLMEKLFDRLKSGKGDRRALLDEVDARLSAHADAEEAEVYPELAKMDPSERGEVHHGTEEHHEAEDMMRKLRSMDPSGAKFKAALKEFVDAVSHHVEEEETDILPALAKAATPTRLREMGEAFDRARKAELKRRGYSDEPGGGRRSVGVKGSDKVKGDLSRLTKDELYERARKADLPGRSTMTKSELVSHLREG